MVTFTEAVHEALKVRRMSLTELSRQSGYCRGYLHELLSGGRRWNQDSVAKVSGVLGIKIEYQVEQETPKASSSSG